MLFFFFLFKIEPQFYLQTYVQLNVFWLIALNFFWWMYLTRNCMIDVLDEVFSDW